VRPDCIVLVIPPGVLVEGPKYGKPTKYIARHYLWPDRPYNLCENYTTDGTHNFLYLNIASKPVFLEGEIRYTDYELDLVKDYEKKRAKLLDEDEFAQAISEHGYTPAFQTECWAAVAEARSLLEDWSWHPEGAPPLYQPGQVVRGDAYKANHQLYRGCLAQVEFATANYVVLSYPKGTPFYGPRGGWTSNHDVRAHLWTDRHYNLCEVREPDGQLVELYVNIASPAEFLPGEVCYTDYELDVVKKPGHPAKVEDEDEFQAAIPHYGYSEAFQQTCWTAVAEALALVDSWPELPQKSTPKR
jgi:protein associated with RNAse G/E